MTISQREVMHLIEQALAMGCEEILERRLEEVTPEDAAEMRKYIADVAAKRFLDRGGSQARHNRCGEIEFRLRAGK